MVRQLRRDMEPMDGGRPEVDSVAPGAGTNPPIAAHETPLNGAFRLLVFPITGFIFLQLHRFIRGESRPMNFPCSLSQSAALAAAAGFFLSPVIAADRAALVIGCGKYRAEGVPELSTPVNDARKMAAALRQAPLNFEVIEAADSTRNQFFEKLDEFKARARGAKVVLIYFSGHGIEAEGVNYLIPVDAVLEKPSHLESEAVPLSRILETIQGTGAEAKVAVLDACRNNPFGRTKSWRDSGKAVSEGVLAALGDAQLPEATLVCFATAPGRKAAAVLNDDSENSPFTECLLKRLGTPGARLRDIFESAADDVAQATKSHQLPYVKYDGSASVLRQLVLAPATAVVSAQTSQPIVAPPPRAPSIAPPAATPTPRRETAKLEVAKPAVIPTAVSPSAVPVSTPSVTGVSSGVISIQVPATTRIRVGQAMVVTKHGENAARLFVTKALDATHVECSIYPGTVTQPISTGDAITIP